jgi:hypothetical protein
MLLSQKSTSGITRCFGRDALDQPERIAAASSTRLNMTIQLGPKSLQEIEELLQKSGFIGNPDTWPGN